MKESAAQIDTGWLRPFLMTVAVGIVGAAGIALKTPFGMFLFHVMGKAPPAATYTWPQWLVSSDWGTLLLTWIGCLLFYRRSGLRASAWLERPIFRDQAEGGRSRVWRPGVLAALLCVLIFAISTFTGQQTPLGSQMGHISHADQMKLMALYPLAFVGAALSEEVIFRFGGISTLMGLFSYIRLGGRAPNNNLAFWIANFAQAAWFGFVHVQQGIVASSHGHSLAFATAIAPQTWSGVVFGYVYRRWGIESAIIAHMATDILVPIFLAAVGRMHL